MRLRATSRPTSESRPRTLRRARRERRTAAPHNDCRPKAAERTLRIQPCLPPRACRLRTESDRSGARRSRPQGEREVRVDPGQSSVMGTLRPCCRLSSQAQIRFENGIVGHDLRQNLASVRRRLPLPTRRAAASRGAGAEVGHVLVLRQPVDRLLDELLVLAEHRAVAGEQDFGVVGQNARQRRDEICAGPSRGGRRSRRRSRPCRCCRR